MNERFSGAPFGSRTARFTSKGIHPKRFVTEPPSNYSLEKKSHLVKRKRRLTYVEEIHSHRESVVVDHQQKLLEDDARKKARQEKAEKLVFEKHKRIIKNLKQQQKRPVPGINWKVAQDVERWVKIPYVLNYDRYQREKLQEARMGPGRYQLYDSIQPQCKDTPGVMHAKVPRFCVSSQHGDFAPGPGTYERSVTFFHPTNLSGKPGKYTCMESCRGHGQLDKSGGSGLAPGTYQKGRGPLDECWNRVIGKRGPYDIFSGHRLAPIRTGWLAAKEEFESLFPRYTAPSLLDDQMRNKHSGKFCLSNHSSRPLGRMIVENAEHLWAEKPTTSPASYDPKLQAASQSFLNKKVAFYSSSPRFDALYIQRFTKDYHSCGPGRYNVKKSSSFQLRQIEATNLKKRFRTLPVPNTKGINLEHKDKKKLQLVVDYFDATGSCDQSRIT